MAQTNEVDGRTLRDSAISHVPLTFGPELALPAPNRLIRAKRYNVQSFVAAGAVWLNLGSPRQRCGPRAAVAGRDLAILPRLPGEMVYIMHL